MQRVQERGLRVPGMAMRLGILAMFILPFLVAPAQAAPRVVVDQSVYDAGEVPQDKPIAHAFSLRNTGDADLTIKVKPC